MSTNLNYAHLSDSETAKIAEKMPSELKYGNITSSEAMELEERYGAHNYHPLPVVLAKGEGVFVWDPEEIVIMIFFLPILQ